LSKQGSHPVVFDRRLLQKRRDRMAMRFADFDFLVKEMTERVAERLVDVRRSFERTLVLGCHTGQVTAGLPKAQVGDVIQADLSPAMVEQVKDVRLALALDEERLPFGFDCFDLVIAVGNLHWVNDLPGTLIQIRYALKPDGLLLAALPGGRTLHELRACLSEAEAEFAEGAVAPRVAPFIDVPDAGDLLRRAGYALPVADIDTLTVTYAHPLKLLHDLRGMAESNVLIESASNPLRRSILLQACRLYQENHADSQERIPATFQLLNLAAWSPGPGQPKPLRRGSGQASLADVLGE
jgi:SAM-dependent methyltransferase